MSQAPSTLQPKNPKSYVIGLDLGTSSVGWAAVEIDSKGEPIDLIALGSRHFEEVLDDKGKKLKNEKRREMRGARRNLARRRMKKKAVLRLLQEAKLVAEGETPFASTESTLAPYEIRSRAATEPVTLEELGRAIYHLAQRRGFKSNRGAKLAGLEEEPEVRDLLQSDEPGEDEDNDTGVVLAAIKDLEDEMGGLTLGQFFYQELLAGKKVRRRYTKRSHYEQEFNVIWNRQRTEHPRTLTDDLKVRLYKALFYQRPLRPQKFLVGFCSLEPTKRKAAKATLTAQRFRIWQDLANLELLDHETGEKRSLTFAEKERLFDVLDTKNESSWTEVAKTLVHKLHSPKKEGIGLSFNLQRTYDSGLAGNKTRTKITKKSGDLWSSLDPEGQRELVEIMLTCENRATLYRTLRSKYNLDPKIALDLAVMDLEDGYAMLSSRAMEKILAQMKAGLKRTEAQIAAGYTPWLDVVEPQDQLNEPPKRQDITSPRVRKALNQTRKVVNALIREYGKPERIRIEMAREMSLSKKERAEWEKVKKEGEILNNKAKEALIKMGIQNPTHCDITWYRLASQLNWICPYSGATIPQTAAATGEFQIEHIVPYEISFDSSFNNLTIGRQDYNLRKGKKTPFQAFGGTKEWPEMCERIEALRGPGSRRKIKLFQSEETPDEDKMISRQLNESKWIAREAATYLEPLTKIAERNLKLQALPDEDRPKLQVGVDATRGAATAMLRYHWGLMEALYQINEKRRDDLRHHAIDAVAIALTSRSIFNKVSAARKGSKKPVVPLSNELVPEALPWLMPKLRQLVPQVVVSHETTRQILGAFHEETVYGRREEKVYHIRKRLASLTDSEVERIIDEKLKAAVLQRIADYISKHGKLDMAKAFADGLPFGNPLPAQRARILARIKDAKMIESPSHRPTKFMLQGNNHHVAIFENIETGKRIGQFKTMVEAAQTFRHSKRKSAVETNLAPGWKFIMWLAGNDTIRTETGIYRVQALDPASNRVQLREVQAATVSDQSQRVLKSINQLHAVKLEVDYLGRVREVPEGTV